MSVRSLINDNNTPVKECFYRFLYNRQAVWYNRFVLSQPRPWTEDYILHANKFTNIYRELDRGTKYLLEVIKPNCSSFKEYLFNCMAYRLTNLTISWDACVPDATALKDHDSFNYLDFIAPFIEMKKTCKIFTAAHFTPYYRASGTKCKITGFGMILQMVFDELDQFVEDIENCVSLEDVCKRIKKYPCYGGFLSYEVATDLTYWETFHLDSNHWCNPGPGAVRGACRVFPDENLNKLSKNPNHFNELAIIMRDDQEAYFNEIKHYNPESPHFLELTHHGQYLCLRGIEHSFCEFDKYHRTLMGAGRCKQKYNEKTSNKCEEIFNLVY